MYVKCPPGTASLYYRNLRRGDGLPEAARLLVGHEDVDLPEFATLLTD